MRTLAPVLWLTLLLGGCDNVGRIYDPEIGGGGPGSGTQSGVQEMVTGGNAETNRPRVEAVFPEGGGWPDTVPIVVVFSETMNTDSISSPATSGSQPSLYVRMAGVGNPPLPASYDFLFGNRVAVIRPQARLINPVGTPDFEVVIQPEVTDGDGITFGGLADNVLASFTADEATGGSSLSNIENGRILVTLPRGNEQDVRRETPVYAIFTKPVDSVSVLAPATGFQLEVGSAPVAGTVSLPLTGLLFGSDGRVLRFDPTSPELVGNTDHEIVVDDSITFGGGNGVLEFSGTPFSTFRTLDFTAAADLRIGNPVAGFANRVNLSNFNDLKVDVDVDSSAQSGDRVVVRIYGLDPETSNATDVNFVESSADLVANGAQTRSVDFSGALGSLADPQFSDGPLTLAVQLQRGSDRRTGYILSDRQDPPILDTVEPDLTDVGPPGSGFDLFVDQEHVSLYGQATEQLGAARLTFGGLSADLFASDASGGFVLAPISLGLSNVRQAYQLTLTDAAGNVASSVFSGDLIPRGVVRDSVTTSGALTVEVYDEITFAAVAGASVVVQPDPASSVGRVVMSTDVNGIASFSGLPDPMHTITVVANGYHLKTLMDTGAGWVSLAARPTTGDVATFSGTAAFNPTAGTSVLIGHNLIDDVLEEDIATTTAAPNTIPPTSIRPNRTQVVTAFSGRIEPLVTPAFSFAACQMCGPTGLVASAPGEPVAPGASESQTLVLLPPGPSEFNLAAPFPVDFGAAAGLDTANLVSDPTVRVVGGLLGFPGQTLLGVGLAQATTAPAYSVNATFHLGMVTLLSPYAPVLYVSTEATDQSGNTSRHRAAVLVILGIAIPFSGPQGIPTIADPPPGTPFSGAPLVTYDDHVDPPALAGSLAFLEITATDQAGTRHWTVLRQDTDGVNLGATVQLPDLTGTGVTGLAAGNWSIRTETHLIGSLTFGTDSYLFEEIRRQQILYARAAPVQFTVN